VKCGSGTARISFGHAHRAIWSSHDPHDDSPARSPLDRSGCRAILDFLDTCRRPGQRPGRTSAKSRTPFEPTESSSDNAQTSHRKKSRQSLFITGAVAQLHRPQTRTTKGRKGSSNCLGINDAPSHLVNERAPTVAFARSRRLGWHLVKTVCDGILTGDHY